MTSKCWWSVTGDEAQIGCITFAINRDMAIVEIVKEFLALDLYVDYDIIGFEEHSWDCWLKTSKEPREDDEEFLDFIGLFGVEFHELIIRKPGQHPGLNAWWIDLPGPVIKPILKERQQLTAPDMKKGD